MINHEKIALVLLAGLVMQAGYLSVPRGPKRPLQHGEGSSSQPGQFGSRELQAISNFLSRNREPTEFDSFIMGLEIQTIMRISDAIRIGFSQTPEARMLLAGTDLPILRVMADSLLTATKSCDPDSLQFLEQVRDHLTTPDQVLNKYAIFRLNECASAKRRKLDDSDHKSGCQSPFGRAEMQAIEALLTRDGQPAQFELPSLAPSFTNIVQTIHGIGPELIAFLDPVDYGNPLCGTDSDTVRLWIESLAKAAESCDPDSLGFLTTVRDTLTNEGQYLHNFAIHHLKRCSDLEYTALVDGLSQILDETDEVLLPFLTLIVNQLQADQAASTSSNFDVNLNPLISISLMSDQRHRFVNAFARVFEETNATTAGCDVESNAGSEVTRLSQLHQLRAFFDRSLSGPCDVMVNRVKEHFGRQDEDGMSALFAAVNARRSIDEIFNYQMEIWRICLELRRFHDLIWVELEKREWCHIRVP